MTIDKDAEVKEKTEIPNFFLDGIFTYLGQRLFGYGQDYRFEYCSRKLIWNIDSLILTINLDDGEKNIWIKKPKGEISKNQPVLTEKLDEEEIGEIEAKTEKNLA